MNILFLDAYYEPETIAYTHLEKDLIEGLIANGHKIHIVCPVPTRNISEEQRKEYKRIKSEVKYGGKVTISRFWAPKEQKNPLIRAFRYLWCNLRTYQKAIRIENIDIVFSNSTPPTQGALSGMVACKLSKKRKMKVPFIYNLQDIFPDSLVNAQLSREGSLLWKVGRKLEDFTYNHADKIVLISEGFKRNILAKGVSEEKIEVVSNWIDLETVRPVERKDNKLISEFKLDPKKFIVVYAGNFGVIQGAEIILKAAEELKEYKEIQFVIFGGGAYFEKARDYANCLGNVFIHELMPKDRISEVYSLGDIALITCKKGTGRAGMPSKMWSILACNTPIVASFDTDSDLADVIRESEAGECVDPENTCQFSEAILKRYLRCNAGHYKENRLRTYVYKYASRSECVKKFVDCIETTYIYNSNKSKVSK